ncbi:energy-coupling factor transporter transmembrane component T family protein [Sporolactobacillus nakayamae]|uniref:Energy-coupling factor transport system permease protein n=1 Tax=Sporolactobacillus nakayamae TaxID=269670 RepID=A0A1I2QV81_9BACL|nr:energy-coupling factor transporter transmembrane component T [Sporolactobacillus nakayamae]SFG31940.1 energy-coupling factor transport system permease protein [Sporolactobacillus nakayamae]
MRMHMLSYIDRATPIHQMTGAAKLICFILWSVIAMTTFDTRVLVFMLITGVIIFWVAKVRLSEISFVLSFILVFLLLNNLGIYIFAPRQGTTIYGTTHILVHLPGIFSLTCEQLFYQLNVSLKYFAVIPFALLFIVTTQPSEFAASLNRIGVSYRIAYAVSITLRYIPDVQRSYHEIAQAQQARGVDLSGKQKFGRRIRRASAIVIPLIISTLDRIEVVSNAMELRRFGKKKKRTWYHGRPFTRIDYLAVLFAGLLLILSLWLTLQRGSRYYNPFI